MKYEEVPRPRVEQHPHIRQLIERQEVRAKDRNLYREKNKALAERNDLIRDAQDFILMDFHCRECNDDFMAQTIKEVEVDWSNTAQDIAFYKTKCFKGHWCIRYITDKNRDPYWFKSKRVALDRGKHHGDLLQSFETGYNILYSKK